MNSQGQDIATIYSDDNANKNITDMMFNKARGHLFVLRTDEITVMDLQGNVIKTISDTTNHSLGAELGPFSPDGQYYSIKSGKGFSSIRDYDGHEVYVTYDDYIRSWNSQGGLLLRRESLNSGEIKDSAIVLNGIIYPCKFVFGSPWGWYRCTNDTLKIIYRKEATNDTIYVSSLPLFNNTLIVGCDSDILQGAISKSILSFSPLYNQVTYGTIDDIKLYNFDKKELRQLKINSR